MVAIKFEVVKMMRLLNEHEDINSNGDLDSENFLYFISV